MRLGRWDASDSHLLEEDLVVGLLLLHRVPAVGAPLRHLPLDLLPVLEGVDVEGGQRQEAAPRGTLVATDKHVIVIGGGDTGSDCVGTSNRQGAKSVTQIEIMPKPPEKEDKLMTWPNWPHQIRPLRGHLHAESMRTRPGSNCAKTST